MTQAGGTRAPPPHAPQPCAALALPCAGAAAQPGAGLGRAGGSEEPAGSTRRTAPPRLRHGAASAVWGAWPARSSGGAPVAVVIVLQVAPGQRQAGPALRVLPVAWQGRPVLEEVRDVADLEEPDRAGAWGLLPHLCGVAAAQLPPQPRALAPASWGPARAARPKAGTPPPWAEGRGMLTMRTAMRAPWSSPASTSLQWCL